MEEQDNSLTNNVVLYAIVLAVIAGCSMTFLALALLTYLAAL
jgi:hypothetical protein